MKFKPQVIFSLVILVFFLVFVYQAREWRLQARLYPWAIGVPMIVITLLHISRELFSKGEKKPQPTSSNTPVDFQFTKGVDERVARRRTIAMFSWIFGFFGGIWLIGFSLMVPLFVFLYLKVQSRETWGLSIVLTGAAWLIFWGLFQYLLRLPFPDGQVMIWLGIS
jgi:hypothetical protein